MDNLTLDLTVRERYQLLQFLPDAPRHVVMGPYQEIEDELGLTDEEVEAWGFQRIEGGVRRQGDDDEATRTSVAMPRRLWVRIRAGADSIARFPNTPLAKRSYQMLVAALNEAVVQGTRRNGQASGKSKKTSRSKT